MRIIICGNIQVMQFIRPHLVIDEMVTDKVSYENQLESIIEHEPENVFIPVAFSAEEEAIAFLVAYSPVGSNHVFISQAWRDAKTENSVADTIFLRLINWMRLKGKSTMLMETKRDPRAFTRRWGFDLHSAIMSKQITDDLERELITNIQKGTNHGQQQSENGVDLDGQPEAGGESTEPVTAWEPTGRSPSDSLRGSDSPEPEPGIPKISELPQRIQPSFSPKSDSTSD